MPIKPQKYREMTEYPEKKRPIRIYLACPYSHPEQAVIEQRVETCNMVAARLMEQGFIVFSPVSHSHPISIHAKVDPCNHDFWLNQDLPFLEFCDELCILMLDGWEQSKGIKLEIERAQELKKYTWFIA